MTLLTRQKLEEFTATWQSPRGLVAGLSAVNNTVLGKRFMLTAFSFFLVGGALALLMRLQLAVPENTFLGPDVYNQLFTMHGSTMMYLFAVPFLEGLAIYLVPMMVGSRDLAFPRLTAFGYWTYLFGGLVFYASFLVGRVPDVGWFAYTPLSGPAYSGLGTDFWLLGLSLVEFSGITAGVEIVVTALKLRAPGMSIGRLPLFVWAILTAGVMIIFAFTTLLTATILLEMDRTLGTKFFDPVHGGSTLLWQHLFWFFGHPEVYIIFLPATGIVSMVVTAFARRLVGYALIAVAIILTGFVSFGLWVHHMYTTGLPQLSMAFFAAASLMIAIASGTQVFAWIASLWGSRPPLRTPLLFVLGFVFIFVLGGLTGVMIAVVPFDWQVHDTYFIVAHFHYVLIGGAVFPIFAGLHYWLPKITGRLLNEATGKWSFWLTFIGFNVTFFPMHIMGFDAMPRRVYTYPAALGLTWHNLLATAGALVLAAGFLAFAGNFLWSLRRGRQAGTNPWGGDSLEWLIPSPPPSYTFEAPPIVHGRHAAWSVGRGATEPSAQRARDALTAAPVKWRGTLVSDVFTARPEAILHLAGPSYLPVGLAAALVVTSVAVLIKAYLLALAALLAAAVVLIAWLRPNDPLIEMLRDSDLPGEADLPIFTHGTRSVAWWGMIGLLAALATVFGTLLYSYFYVRLYSTHWPQGDLIRPGWILPALVYALLLVSGGATWWMTRGHRLDNLPRMQLALAIALGAAALFLALQVFLQIRLPFTPRSNAYGSLFYVICWLVDLYVLTAIALGTVLLTRLFRDTPEPPEYLKLHVQLTAMFWYFTVAVAVLAFATLYLSPYLI